MASYTVASGVSGPLNLLKVAASCDAWNQTDPTEKTTSAATIKKSPPLLFELCRLYVISHSGVSSVNLIHDGFNLRVLIDHDGAKRVGPHVHRAHPFLQQFAGRRVLKGVRHVAEFLFTFIPNLFDPLGPVIDLFFDVFDIRRVEVLHVLLQTVDLPVELRLGQL